jgi:N-acetylmuramoyl-L-alanine amidase
LIDFVPRPSPNFDTRSEGQAVDILLMHYTGMRTAEEALDRLCDKQARVSSHYTVDEDGTIYRHVIEEYRAFHAGISYWAGETDINACSVGIEIVNPGHEFGYRAFPDAQIEAVIALSKEILGRHPIRRERVIGHSDVAPARKEDPGELFPWEQLAGEGIGRWPTRLDGELTCSFDEGLRRYGYGIAPDGQASIEQSTIAFQRHFRPSKIDGMADGECERILAGLLATLDLPA